MDTGRVDLYDPAVLHARYSHVIGGRSPSQLKILSNSVTPAAYPPDLSSCDDGTEVVRTRYRHMTSYLRFP